jgi:hypothetical protein
MTGTKKRSSNLVFEGDGNPLASDIDTPAKRGILAP